MQWFRLYTEARNDAKLRYLDDSEFRVWFNLLCLAAEQEDRGAIPPMSRTLLAVEVANADKQLLEDTLQKLEELHIVFMDDDEHLIEFINWSKRQYEYESDKPENVRERVKRHRERQKKRGCNEDVTSGNELKRAVTAPDTDTDTDPDTDPIDSTAQKIRKPFKSKVQEALFDEFWARYPKKRSKGRAEKAWVKIAPDTELFSAILDGLERAKKSRDWTKDGGEYIPYPATWLNAKGWEDEHEGVVDDGEHREKSKFDELVIRDSDI